MLKNVFNNPESYRKSLLDVKWLDQSIPLDGRPLICVFFTSYCGVGCPFCFFHSPTVGKSTNERADRKYHFSGNAVDRFIKFANDSNVGYLQISGGGEPFLEMDAILQCVEKIHAKRIILVTSGFWANTVDHAESCLQEIYSALLKNPSHPRLSIRVSISKDHSIKLKEKPLIHLLHIFEQKYRKCARFTLQLKCFENDDTLVNYLEQWCDGYSLTYIQSNGSDDEDFIKVMPWKYVLTLKSGYEVIVGKSRVFIPTLRPDINDKHQVAESNAIFDRDLELSQGGFPAIVYNANGTVGLDWIVEYNGNVCTWQNRVQDNLLNIYEDDYKSVLDRTLNDLITYSFIEKGACYRENIIAEISPKTVSLMKAVNIRDYAGTLLFADEKIRLYYNIRVLQDYIAEGRISLKMLDRLPSELSAAIRMPPQKLIEQYSNATYSILTQELKKPLSSEEFHDFLELIKCNHFELSDEAIAVALNVYNSTFKEKFVATIHSIDDVKLETGPEVEYRLTERMQFRKHIESEAFSTKIILCRHGETNWNIEGRIKGQLDGAATTFTALGMNQISELAKYLSCNQIEAIFTSDMYRAAETSRFIEKELRLPLYFCRQFRGLNMGIFQGELMLDFLKSEFAQKAFSDYSFVIPGGESIQQLNKRFLQGLNMIQNDYTYTTVAVVSHSAAISNMKAYISHEKYEDIDYCVLQLCGRSHRVLAYGTYGSLFKETHRIQNDPIQSEQA